MMGGSIWWRFEVWNLGALPWWCRRCNARGLVEFGVNNSLISDIQMHYNDNHNYCLSAPCATALSSLPHVAVLEKINPCCRSYCSINTASYLLIRFWLRECGSNNEQSVHRSSISFHFITTQCIIWKHYTLCVVLYMRLYISALAATYRT